MADLATLANIGGVVGLADVVIRCTTKLYELVRRISTASQSAARLQTLLQEFVGVIGLVRAWTEDQEQERHSTWKPHDNYDQIGLQVYASLRRAHEQIENLLRGKSTSQARKGWLQLFQSNVVFALNEAQIEHGINAINHHQLTLANLMQVRTSYDVNLLHRQMVALSLDIQNTKQIIAVSSQDSQQKLVSTQKRIELAIQGSTQHLRSTIHAASSGTRDIGKLVMEQCPVQEKPSDGRRIMGLNSPLGSQDFSANSPVSICTQSSGVDVAVEMECDFISNSLMDWLPSVRISGDSSCKYTLEPFRIERSENDGLAFKRISLQASQILLQLNLAAPRLDRITAIRQKSNAYEKLDFSRQAGYNSSSAEAGSITQAGNDPKVTWLSGMMKTVSNDLYAAAPIGDASGRDLVQGEQYTAMEKRLTMANILEAQKPLQYRYSASDTAGVIAVQWRSLGNRDHHLEQMSLAFAINPSLMLGMTGILASFTRVQVALPRLNRQPIPRYTDSIGSAWECEWRSHYDARSQCKLEWKFRELQRRVRRYVLQAYTTRFGTPLFGPDIDIWTMDA